MTGASNSKSVAICEISGAHVPLTVADCVALLYLNSAPDANDLPGSELEKLLGLGLAARSGRQILYTDQGRAMASRLADLVGRASPVGAKRPISGFDPHAQANSVH